ncbi:MAG: YvcK family protein [Candidatus Pacebacteria bacterium]|nr:YvcK family protein [Candidatus Paceibacterota bacterium]
MKEKNVVCFGGGSAMPKAILSSLVNYPVKITSITSMVDNGGSTGQLREDFGVLPPGDIRRHILALSNAPQWKKELWNFRFGREVFDGGHKGHNFANVFMTGLEKNLGDYGKVLEFVHEFMEVKGNALPATVEQTQICAELENGEIVKGEDEIDVPKTHNPNLKIKKVYLNPKVESYKPSLDAITNADLIIIGPGDLYSSIIPCFLSKEISQAFQKSKAKKIYVCNTMTKLGETNNFSISDFSNEVEKYIGTTLDFVIYNTKTPSTKIIKEYKKQQPTVLEIVKSDIEMNEKKFIGKDVLEDSGAIVYDSKKIVELIMSLM